MEIFSMVFASIISLFMGYFVCVLLLFVLGNRMFLGPSEKKLEGISDEEFADHIDEYLQNGAEQAESLQKRKLRIKMSESILAIFILISRHFVK
ncbi:MAG: hypothetical protein ACI33K_12495 [Clostridiaceae bacterium]